MSAPQKAPEVIEILSDSEPEDVVKDDLEDLPELLPEANDHDDQPLLRAAGIKYKTRDHDEEDDSEEDAEQEEDDLPDAPTRSTVSPRVLRSGKRVTIDTTESKSSSRRTKSSSSVRESEQHNEGEAFKTTLGRKHIKFDDSEQEEFVTPREGPMENPFESIKPAAQNGPGDESEEESDNEAPPEAVSTRVAEAESLKAAKAAAKAAEQQAAELKRKRQERDARLKRQAAERKRNQKLAKPDDEGDEVEDGEESSAVLKRKRETPKLLPLELLESDDDDDEALRGVSSSGADAKQKRMKLGAEHPLLRDPKHPKDKRIGSTAYRVVKSKGDSRLAPKVAKHNVNLREMLLRRDRAPVPRGGFFRSRS